MSHHDHHDPHDHPHCHHGVEHSHPHDHDNGHTHDDQAHSHPHDHTHSEDHRHDHGSAEMSFPEKMRKLLDHWIRHNDDHAKTYQNWAEQARQNQLARAAVLIEEAAAMSFAVNEKFEQARALVDKK